VYAAKLMDTFGSAGRQLGVPGGWRAGTPHCEPLRAAGRDSSGAGGGEPAGMAHLADGRKPVVRRVNRTTTPTSRWRAKIRSTSTLHLWLARWPAGVGEGTPIRTPDFFLLTFVAVTATVVMALLRHAGCGVQPAARTRGSGFFSRLAGRRSSRSGISGCGRTGVPRGDRRALSILSKRAVPFALVCCWACW
jgi:hypothetical protein